MTRRLTLLLTAIAGVLALSRLAIEGTDPAATSMNGLRLLALGLGWYLIAVSALGLTARLTRSAQLVRAVDVVTLPGVRRLLNGAVGLSLLAGTVSATPAGASAPERSAPPVMQMVSDAPAPPPAPVAPVAPAPPIAVDAPSPDHWLVRPGQNFWVVAHHHLRDVWSREPSDGEIARYWRVLIEANRDRLARPEQPGLIFPGQIFVLPPVG
jgi:nucleoid-associated protein YgaU